MAYKPINWVDHVNSGNKYKLTNNPDGTTNIDYAGKVIQQGTPLAAENFNHMEQGIAQVSQQFEEKLGGHTVGVDVPANAKFTDTTYSDFVKSGSGAKAGLVPAPPTTAGIAKYLREDGTWVNPNIKWYVGSDAESSDGWYHFLSKEMSTNEDFNIMLSVTNTFANVCAGILHIHIRRNMEASVPLNRIVWLTRTGFSIGDVINVVTGTKVDFYIRNTIKQYDFIHFDVISQMGRGSRIWTYTPIFSTAPTESLTATVTSEDGGAVLSASRLFNTVNIGSETEPVYFKNGNPVVCKQNTAKKVQNSGDVLFNDTGTNITSCSINGLFTNNSFVLATITSDKYGVKQYILPMAHLKAKGWLKLADSGTSDSTSDLINFQYQNDNTLMWFEKQDSGAAKYTAVTLIKML